LERTAPVALRPAISLFRAGGRAIAAAIHRAGCDTLAARPTVPSPTKARLVLRAMMAVAVGRCRESLLGQFGSAGGR
jgi:phytoene/squalene synthetase